MTLDRRAMLTGIASIVGASGVSGAVRTAQSSDFSHPFENPGLRRENLALLLYPGMTILDVVGPYHFLCFMGGAEVHLVTNQPSLDLVVSDAGMGIRPTTTMSGCPSDLDLLLVPGGTDGTLRAARDPATIAFVRDRALRAHYVSSVCTGSLILGVAGLLRDRRATSHWNVVDLLSQFGAIPTLSRVVEDGNVITAAGVSAGMDLGITLVERLRGRPLAEAAVLATEYAPNPRLRGGDTRTARPEIVNAVNVTLRSFTEQASRLRIAD